MDARFENISEKSIIGVCPTYKRPEMLKNVLSCFLNQDFDDSHLLIYDDANQYGSSVYSTVKLVSTDKREPTLAHKYDEAIYHLIQQNYLPDSSIIAIIEDDDLYAPNHFSSLDLCRKIHSPFYGDSLYLAPTIADSDYGMPFGQFQTEVVVGRFHASWAFSVGLLKRLKDETGSYYPLTAELNFDQQQRDRCLAHGHRVSYVNDKPTYCYRWAKSWNASARSDEAYRTFYNDLAERPAAYVPKLIAEMDEETHRWFRYRGFQYRAFSFQQ